MIGILDQLGHVEVTISQFGQPTSVILRHPTDRSKDVDLGSHIIEVITYTKAGNIPTTVVEFGLPTKFLFETES